MPKEMQLSVGEIVRVPLGTRDVYGYVVSPMHEPAAPRDGLRAVAGYTDRTTAFDEVGLHLAQWIAEHYCCTLSDALSAVVLAAAIPRAVDRFSLAGPRPAPERLSAVPPRLLRLIWDDLSEGFTLEALLRHPDARRAGDRGTLLRALGALVRAGALERKRTFHSARMEEATERILEATGKAVRGPRLAQLLARVNEEGTLRRRDAALEGFSSALIARALREGALRETVQRAARAPRKAGGAPPAFEATPEQRVAIDTIVRCAQDRAFAEILLNGITGSGKTFVYIEAIRTVVAAGGRAIVLVPEIALTPQTARRFESAFERVAVLHSGLSERERFESRHAAARGEVDVVVGARSAVFAPLPDTRLIVVDEAHERTYKQDSTPRYHATDVARERMRVAGGVLVLGSATPPLEAYEAAERGAIGQLHLHARATAQALPVTHVVDLGEEFERANRRIFSTRLVEGMSRRLALREKTVLFLNRRGSASFFLCRSCGVVPECVRCSISLTVHRAEGLMRCHLCDAQLAIPVVCPTCGLPAIREFGVGTQKVVETAQALFPDARIIRMDSDTTTRVGDHARLLDQFEREGDILVGTQMVAKGLDFPAVTLVGVVAADLDLHLPDFRAAERTFDLLTQVAGRSGRARPGEAIVQTYSPEHPAVACAARHDYAAFAEYELAQRKALRYPPYGGLVYLGVIGRRQADVVARAQEYAELLRTLEGAEVLGPAPFPVARMNDEWRYRIAIKLPDTAPIRAFIRERIQKRAANDRATRLLVNVDP